MRSTAHTSISGNGTGRQYSSSILSVLGQRSVLDAPGFLRAAAAIAIAAAAAAAVVPLILPV